MSGTSRMTAKRFLFVPIVTTAASFATGATSTPCA
jgi:hypothetical protein